ncbi:MAG TPA: hypothetical protein VMN35_01375 [Gaiellaceae bacterium]|nr:hypothetical protein [Gaiellaceae bacterium]
MRPAQPPLHVSTGELPPPNRVAELVAKAHARFLSVDDGEVSDV